MTLLKKFNSCFVAMVAIAMLMAAMMVSCGQEDEPQPPTPPTIEDETPDWGDERPFFLMDSVTGMVIRNKTEDGYLYNTEKNCDYFVVEYQWILSPRKTTLKGNMPICFFVDFTGDKLSPFENVERYNRMCRKMGARPLSAFNDSSLNDLPFYIMRYNHTMETYAKFESFMDRDPETGIPASDGMMPGKFIGFYPYAEKSYIKKNLNVLDPPHLPEGISLAAVTPTILEDHPEIVTWFGSSCEIHMTYPTAPETYTVTIRITTTTGKVLEDTVKIKFMPEGTEYPEQ